MLKNSLEVRTNLRTSQPVHQVWPPVNHVRPTKTGEDGTTCRISFTLWISTPHATEHSIVVVIIASPPCRVSSSKSPKSADGGAGCKDLKYSMFCVTENAAAAGITRISLVSFPTGVETPLEACDSDGLPSASGLVRMLDWMDISIVRFRSSCS